MRGLLKTLVPVGLLVGCAEPLMWTKPGATQADFNRDSYECQKDAYATGGAVYLGYGVTTRTANSGMYNQCMVVRGYTQQRPSAAPTSSYGVDRGPLVNCKLPNLAEPVTTASRSCAENGGTVVP